ncbi:DUF4232 domain-containing protein [Bailinhaonella thermotolerans]|uniref:DUF4232 domain-containing protein n=1 Tax=Bailinhaonella thermotolerans TaxID=1070861 RepID=A0A3A4ANK0_9ACTN|nr:DUF4232 domain-containing protein [Bailinhaonella thermotolerans]RJL27190.1 DUF4232 domain-containing protein [Bailinhaonella thermotolerans]
MTAAPAHRPRVTLTGGALLLALALAGCQASGGAPAPAGAPGTVSATASAADPAGSPAGRPAESPAGIAAGEPPSGPTTAPPADRAGKGGPAPCRAAALRAETQEQESDSEEKVLATLILTNTSAAPCHIPAGWAPLGGGAPGAYRALPAERREHPGPGVATTLKPGASVFAGLLWGTGPDCPGPGSLAVSWNGSWIPVESRWTNGPRPACEGTLVLGTLQPIMNGVNFT